MEYIDLLNFIKANNGVLHDVEVHGYIYSRLRQPKSLDTSRCDLEQGGIFVHMIVIAVDLSNYSEMLKKYGIYNERNQYTVNGSICMYVSANGKYPDYYSSRVILRQTSKKDEAFLSGFDLVKTGGKWLLNCNKLTDIDGNKFSDSMYDIFKGNARMPQEVLSLPQFHSVEKDITIDIKSNSSMSMSMSAETTPESIIHTEKPVSEGRLTEKPVSASKQNRFGVEPFSKVYDEFNDSLKSGYDKLRNIVEAFKRNYPKCDADRLYVIDILERFRDYMDRAYKVGGKTGRYYLNMYFSNWKKLAKAKYMGVSCAKYVLNNFNEVVDYVKDDELPMMEDECLELVERGFSDIYLFFESIVGLITKVKLTDVGEKLNQYGISLIQVVRENPYILFVMGYISFKDADLLNSYFGKTVETDLIRIRRMCLIYDFISDKGSNDTAYSYETLYRNQIGETITAHRYTHGMNKVAVIDTEAFLLRTPKEYVLSDFVKKGYSYIRPMNSKEKATAINDFISCGLGCKVGRYYTTTNLLSKELYVYNTLYTQGSVTYNYDDELVDQYIKEYESEVGFKLEERQRDAIKLIKYGSGVLTGGAGSGKTTTEGCMVSVLKKLEPNVEVRYGAPTGKAAKVMQGVVKEKAQTLHSMCRIGTDEESLLESDYEEEACESNVVYIFDEVSMVTIDLLYKVLKKLGNIRVYFVGDINQLSAIGKGLVLKNLLRFLPCVYLTVSKRSASNSGITLNSDIINNYSDKTNWLKLEDKSDFVRIELPDDRIQSYVYDLCKNLIEQGVSKDDIQVVSPLVQGKYTWGANSLNNVLQPLFNTNKRWQDRVWTGNKYLINGDRVIQTKLNINSMQWYEYDGKSFTKIYGYGIANGEVGKVLGVFDSNTCIINEPTEEKPEDCDIPANVRKDENYDGAFLAVVYYDYMSERDFVILYRCKLKDDEDHGKTVYGDDISCIDLFYCGSVHKLQGSQSKYIIGCFGTLRFKGFLTRNMLYTLVSRASKQLYLLGSVSDDIHSQLSQARLEVDDDGVLTIGELLVI